MLTVWPEIHKAEKEKVVTHRNQIQISVYLFVNILKSKQIFDRLNWYFGSTFRAHLVIYKPQALPAFRFEPLYC